MPIAPHHGILTGNHIVCEVGGKMVREDDEEIGEEGIENNLEQKKDLRW